MRKTSKYFREELAKQQSNSSMISLLTEIIKKYGGKNGLYIDNTKCYWNHWLNGMELNKKNEILLNVYWQGDSTDGDICVKLSEVLNRGRVIIGAEHFFDGYRTRCTHGDIEVTKDEFNSLITRLIEWLSPNEIKERKFKAQFNLIKRNVSDILGNDYFRKYAKKFGDNQEYYNGKCAVMEFLTKYDKEVVKMGKEELLEKVDKIFQANFKNDKFFGGDKWGVLSKPYIINI